MFNEELIQIISKLGIFFIIKENYINTKWFLDEEIQILVSENTQWISFLYEFPKLVSNIAEINFRLTGAKLAKSNNRVYLLYDLHKSGISTLSIKSIFLMMLKTINHLNK